MVGLRGALAEPTTDRLEVIAVSSPEVIDQRRIPLPGWTLLAASASVAAGLVHGAVIGVHGDDRTLVWLFSAAALLQCGLGIALFAQPRRWVLSLCVAANLAVVTTWLLSRTTGIGFVASLKKVEPVALTDGICALLGAIAVVASLAALSRPRPVAFPAIGALVVPVFLTIGLLTLPALVAAPGHATGGGGPRHVHAGAVARTAAAAKPFDPTQPIDLSGTPGATRAQQKRAEVLLRSTLEKLPQFADPAVAEAAGYHSIGDGFSGHEHFMKWDSINDTTFFDPDHPESLVYRYRNGQRTLEAAMFLLPDSYGLDTVPDIGGPLTQFHIHDDLCFTNDPVAPQLVGLTSSGGSCGSAQRFRPAPMVHVWIKPNVCGPFSALEGAGAGQVKTGETRSCDHSHGSTTTF
jgi:hypothetical protein